MNRRRAYLADTDLEDDDIVADGETVRVRLNLLDGLHRPGQAKDAFSPRTMLDAASDDLRERRGMSLERAQRLRDAAFQELERRSTTAWRGGRDDVALLRAHGVGPDADEEGDDDDDDASDALAKAEADREAAYQESVQRMSNAWRANPNATNTEKLRQVTAGGA